jgi:hypothetical protein
MRKRSFENLPCHNASTSKYEGAMYTRSFQ